MSKDQSITPSNGPPADGSMTDPRRTRDRASKCTWIKVRTRHALYRGQFAGFIDLARCKCIFQRSWNGIEPTWKMLFLTPGGRFFVGVIILKPNEEWIESYGFFVTEREAAGWFADEPARAPECMMPLIEKFDLTMSPAEPPEPPAATPSENGIDTTEPPATPGWAPSRGGPDEMTATMEDMLVALMEMNALDEESREPSPEIIYKAFEGDASNGNARAALKELARRGYLGSKEGRRGGYWLTEKGKDMARKLAETSC